MNRTATIALTVAIALLAWGARISNAQVPGFKRVELQRHDIGTSGREALLARGDFEPGAAVPKHKHPGEEVGYVLTGELTLEIEGKPPVKLKAGDTFFVPAGTVHAGKNSAKGATSVLSTYVIEKGKPLATMVK